MLLIDPDRPVAIRLIEVKGMLATMQGLLGRPDLPPGYGVMLKAKEVHTVGMRFPIDTVYLTRRGLVLRVATMQPGKLGPVMLKARWIVELRAGEAQRLGIVAGQTLITTPDPEAGPGADPEAGPGAGPGPRAGPGPAT